MNKKAQTKNQMVIGLLVIIAIALIIMAINSADKPASENVVGQETQSSSINQQQEKNCVDECSPSDINSNICVGDKKYACERKGYEYCYEKKVFGDCTEIPLFVIGNKKIDQEGKFAVLSDVRDFSENFYEFGEGDIEIIKSEPTGAEPYHIGYVLTRGENCMNNMGEEALGSGMLKEGYQKITIKNTHSNIISNKLCLKLINTDFDDWDNPNSVNVWIAVYQYQ